MTRLEEVDSQSDLPSGVVELAAEAGGEGFRMLDRLLGDWTDGTQRFAGPGEVFLVAYVDDQLVGVGGVTACPEVLGAQRVRRFYVSPTARRAGVARRLADHVMRVGFGHADTLTLPRRRVTVGLPVLGSDGLRAGRSSVRRSHGHPRRPPAPLGRLAAGSPHVNRPRS